jgi:regulator of protease activity HflC (stomatin/prohibitin superfamily)
MKTLFQPAILIAAISILCFHTSCRVIKQGDVGVKRTLGKIKDNVVPPGAKLYNPFVTRIIAVPVRTVNLEVELQLPSKEGLNVEAEISILYHVEQEKATDVISTIGQDFERTMILPVFRAAAADVTAQFMAKDMHTGNRTLIESTIQQRMMKSLEPRGFVIESVLLKSIKLPVGLYRAIEEKLQAEQEAQRMQFVLEREQQEAKRREIEATGIRDANQIISEGLTPEIIKYQALEVYRELSKSTNAKVIIGGAAESLIIAD